MDAQARSGGEARKIANVCLFTGPEQLLKRRALETLRKRLLPEGFESFNETVLENASAAQVIEACETLPMLCERRLTVVYDFGCLAPGHAKNETVDAEQMAAWLPTAPDTNCLVFYMREAADARKKLTQTLKSCAVVTDFQPLDDAKVLAWAAKELMPYAKTIDAKAVSALTFTAGRSLETLAQELGKLAAYVGSRSAVTARDVEAIVTPTVECTVFQMIDAVLDAQPLRARLLLKTMLENGQNRIGILAALTRQMRMLTHIRLMRDAGEPLPAIQRALELNPYASGRAARQAAAFAPQALETCYRACVETDALIKGGRARDDEALDMLLLRIDAMSQRRTQ